MISTYGGARAGCSVAVNCQSGGAKVKGVRNGGGRE